MKQVTVQYFASLREQRGLSEEAINTEAATVADLYRDLQLRLDPVHLRCAIDGDIGALSREFKDGAVIVLIPPVAGG